MTHWQGTFTYTKRI